MTGQWLDLGRGTGKRPDGVLDDDVVRWLWHEQWSYASAKHCHFQPAFKYQLLVRTPAEPDVLRGLLAEVFADHGKVNSLDWTDRTAAALAATEPTKEVM